MWIDLKVEDKVFISTFEAEESKTAKYDLIANIQQRCLKFGRLDDQNQIARKTGAIKEDVDYEKHQNHYDQEDPFIDDEQEEKNGMAIPESQFDDYQMIEGDLQAFVRSEQFEQRRHIIKNSMKLMTPEPKTKHMKKIKKLKDKVEKVDKVPEEIVIV